MTEDKIMRGFCDVVMAFVSCNIARERHAALNCIKLSKDFQRRTTLLQNEIKANLYRF